MTYVEFLNALLRKKVFETEPIVLFGQNISAGSCLSGLTRGLRVQKDSLILNTQNSENTLCGVGFGLLMNGVSSVFFMKQQDFIPLGMDHLVNTHHLVRMRKPAASFTIVQIVMDHGYEGPQSSLNQLGDFCSLAKASGYTITNKADAGKIIGTHLVSPGFRILAVSQRLFKRDLIEAEELFSDKEGAVFQYCDGAEATVVCFSLSFPYGWELCRRLKDRGVSASLFSVNAALPVSWKRIVDNLKRTRNLVLMDDQKSVNRSCDAFLAGIQEVYPLKNRIILKKELSDDSYRPHADGFDVDYESILERLANARVRKKTLRQHWPAGL